MSFLFECRPKMPVVSEAQARKALTANGVDTKRMGALIKSGISEPKAIALSLDYYWKGGGVELTVSFFDSPKADVRKRILSHLNAWSEKANVVFRETSGTGQVRIAFEPDGYWSYLGTYILKIPTNQQTMNLQGFTGSVSETEYRRVVRHEAGHTLGCVHEHMRRALVERIDPQKAYAYFLQTNGWSKNEVNAQVLKPIEEVALLKTPQADQDSIMCYDLPGTITKDGQPIRGGMDINPTDAAFVASVYPKKKTTKPKKKPAKPTKAAKAKKPAKKKGKKTGKKKRPR